MTQSLFHAAWLRADGDISLCGREAGGAFLAGRGTSGLEGKGREEIFRG